MKNAMRLLTAALFTTLFLVPHDSGMSRCLADEPRPGAGAARSDGDRPVVRLWPGKAPGEQGDIGPEHVKNRDAKLGTAVIRLADVTEPTLTVYHPPKDKATGTAVVVCPGGGYNILAWNLEGSEVAEWLNSIGVTALVLKYRVPRRRDRDKHDAPLEDAQRALRVARHHAEQWHVDPNRVGILGFSAGGHLAAAASTNHDRAVASPSDEIDRLSARPDFTVLVYPAYLLAEPGDVNRLAPEIRVAANTPPAILIQTQDDGIHVECAIAYYLALKRAKVPVEMHLYPTGGHGYGLRKTEHDVSSWPDRVTDWLRRRQRRD